jgi:zinc transporter
MRVDTSVADAIADSDVARSPLVSAPIAGLVWAFRIHSDGVPEALPIDRPIPFSHDGLLWLHFNLSYEVGLVWI